MTDNERNEDERMNRRSLIAIASVMSVAVWNKPIVNAIVLPAHAQTSACPNILDVDVIGDWQFTDANGTAFTISFIDNSTVNFDNDTLNSTYARDSSNGDLLLDLTPPRAPARVAISQESNCIASELTVTAFTSLQSALTAPAVGTRI